jgi:hypothetical protein
MTKIRSSVTGSIPELKNVVAEILEGDRPDEHPMA